MHQSCTPDLHPSNALVAICTHQAAAILFLLSSLQSGARLVQSHCLGLLRPVKIRGGQKYSGCNWSTG